MPPRSVPLPSAQTPSAQSLRRNFFCDLCNKGYDRITDFENHENGYDHQHRKRAKEMKSLTKGPSSIVRRNERKRNENEGMISMNLKEAPRREKEGEGRRGFRDIGGVVDKEVVKEDEGIAKDGGSADVKMVKEEEEVWKPVKWEDLSNLYSRIDPATLPPEWQQRQNPTQSYISLLADSEKRKQYYKDDEEILDELGIADEDWNGVEEQEDTNMDLDDDWADFMKSEEWKEDKKREREEREVKVKQAWKLGGPVPA